MFQWNQYSWTLACDCFTHHSFDAWLEMTGRERERTIAMLVTAHNAGAKTIDVPNNINRPAIYGVDGFYWEVAQ